MKCIIILFLIFIILLIIYNLYNFKVIENFNSGGSTKIQRVIGSAVTNMNDKHSEYENENIDEVVSDLIQYEQNFNDLRNRWNNETIKYGSNSKTIDQFNKYNNRTCEFDDTVCINDEFPIIFNKDTKIITKEECAQRCQAKSNCISFSYKDNLINNRFQECRLSSRCTEQNATQKNDFDLYVKNDLTYNNFPLTNYMVDYNTTCRDDIYKDIDNKPSTQNTLTTCANNCNNDKNCISFEFTPGTGSDTGSGIVSGSGSGSGIVSGSGSGTETGTEIIGRCAHKSKCYNEGCLSVGNSENKRCTSTSLYSKKLLIPDDTRIPDYINCNICNNNDTVYNKNFLRFYDNLNDPSNLIYTNDVAKIGNNNISIDKKFYKITDGNFVKLFSEFNFKGQYIWLRSTTDRQQISKIGETEVINGTITNTIQDELQQFKSFKILGESKKTELENNCQGYWKDCDYDDNGNYISEWVTTVSESPNGKCENNIKMCDRDCILTDDIYDISDCSLQGYANNKNVIPSKKKIYQTLVPPEGNGILCEDLKSSRVEWDCEPEDKNKNVPNNHLYRDWGECNNGSSTGTKLGDDNITKSCMWNITGTYESSIKTKNNKKFRYSIEFKGRSDQYNSQLQDTIIFLKTNYDMIDTTTTPTDNTFSFKPIFKTQSNMINEDRDYIIFAGKFNDPTGNFNDINKSYYIKNNNFVYGASNNNIPVVIELKVVDEGDYTLTRT